MTKFADSKESPQIHLKLGDEIRKSVGGIGSFKNFSYLCEKIRNMSENQDIRWVQRLSNYDKAVDRLQNAARIVSTEKQFSGEVDDLLKEGLVQRFEYTQELAWKVMKDYEEYQGYTDVQGSRDAIRKALQMGIVEDSAWMSTISSRNLTSHCYDEEEFNMVLNQIIHDYLPIFVKFSEKMNAIKASEI